MKNSHISLKKASILPYRTLSKIQLVTTGIIVGIIGVAVLQLGFAAEPPKTFYVSPAGNDTSEGSQASPFVTISKAANVATSGDIVLVGPGVYHEVVSLNTKSNGVTFRGSGDTKPIIDGDGVRAIGISLNNGVHDAVIDNFEIRNLAAGGSGLSAGILSYSSHHITIQNNDIHDIHAKNLYSYGIVLGDNGHPGIVHDTLVKNNRIHEIGPGGESMGIWLLHTKQMTLDGNEIYRVRKEGIRDWMGLQNKIINNRTYLNWVGIALNGGTGAMVANNVSYNNVYGFNPKHLSDLATRNTWGLSTGLWTKFWHNTAYANTHASIALAMNCNNKTNCPDFDYLDMQNNIFASAGDVHIHDFPAVRGSHIIVDGNAYSGSPAIYYTGWNSPPQNRYVSLDQLRANLPWEPHGQNFTPTFKDPAIGDFSFDASGLEPGVALDDVYGSQVGARDTATTYNSWVRYPTTVIASSTLPNPNTKQNAGDGTDDRYWFAPTYNKNGWIVFDLGSPKKINTFVLDVFSHADSRNIKNLNIQLSDDNVNYSTPIISATNPDSSGSSYKYILESPATTRYVKLNLVDNFGGSSLVFSDFQMGLLSPVPPPDPPNQAPSVSITAPSMNEAFEEPATIPISAAASDSDGQITKVEYLQGTTKLGESLDSPYQYTWYGVSPGDYTLTVRATDDDGAVSTSLPISIKVSQKASPPPTCTKIEDIYCDGRVNFQDLSALLIKLGSHDEKADIYKDGEVNFQDISYLLSRFAQ